MKSEQSLDTITRRPVLYGLARISYIEVVVLILGRVGSFLFMILNILCISKRRLGIDIYGHKSMYKDIHSMITLITHLCNTSDCSTRIATRVVHRQICPPCIIYRCTTKRSTREMTLTTSY